MTANAYRLIVGVGIALLAVSCGTQSGGGGAGGGAGNDQPAPQTSPNCEQDIDCAGGQVCADGDCIDAPPTCPTPQESFEDMVSATYAVVVNYEVGPKPQDIVHFATGTAFVVGASALATNAHVAEGILNNPWPVRSVVAIRAGTGEVVRLTGAIVHPDYNGDPLASPDIALLIPASQLPDSLPLASDEEASTLALGEELALTGFPGDVTELFDIIPSETVPQATALTGSVSALRSFDASVQVTPDTIDVIQHQVPTTPGTSGSPLVRCGKVIGVHNAGTVELILSFDENGNPTVDRVPAASNNFGIHVKYLQDLMSRAERGRVTETSLPPPPPSYGGKYYGQAYDPVTQEPSHELVLTIRDDGTVTGVSCWGSEGYQLSGTVNRYGALEFRDNGADFGLPVGTYSGYVDRVGGQVWGVYYENDQPISEWSGWLDPGAAPSCELLAPTFAVSITGCPAGEVAFGTRVSLSASLVHTTPGQSVWYDWSGIDITANGTSAVAFMADYDRDVSVSAYEYVDANSNGRWDAGEETTSAEDSCTIDVARPEINGEWGVSWLQDGQLIGLCLTIASERPVEVLNGCDEPNVLLTSEPVFIDSVSVRIDFTMRFPSGWIGSQMISGTARNADFYDVTVVTDFGYAVNSYIGQMDRMR